MGVDALLSKSVVLNFSLLFFNILGYVCMIVILFFLFFLFEIRNFKYLNDFKIFMNYSNLSFIFFCSILSLAGIPPLLGFFNKMLVFFVFLKTNHFYLFVFFILTNIFVVYFYIQNYRFIVSKNNDIQYNVQYNFYICLSIVVVLFLNIFSFGIMEFIFFKINFMFLYL